MARTSSSFVGALDSGSIFFARSDDPWILAGAAVHISFVGQDDGAETGRELDGRPVTDINPDLTSGLDLTCARRLPANAGIAFQGVTLGGDFEISSAMAQRLIHAPNRTAATTVTSCARS